MAVILQINSGPFNGRKTYLRPGQVLKVGRTEWSEFNVPSDSEMAEVHFALDCGYGICRVRDLSKGLGTLVNGKPVTDADVLHGDQITAGQTLFLLRIEEVAAQSIASGGAASGQTVTAAGKSGFATITALAKASEVCAKVELEPAATKLLNPTHNVRQFFDVLVENKLFAEATRFLAHALPKREAVWWAAVCIRAAIGDLLSPKDTEALKAAEHWVLAPTEENRVAAMPPAEATGFDTAAGWAAGGAFWSGGSLLPAGMAIVPPKDSLTAQGVAVAVTLSAIATGLAKQPATYAASMELGRQVADGKNRWPDAPAA